MFNLLLDDTAKTGATGGQWWIYVVLIVLVVVMLVLPSISNRRRMKEYNQMLDQLRVGDEVRTIGGVIGKVIKINTKNDIKTFVLETGAKGSKTTMEFDIASVGTVLKSTYVAPVEEKKEEVKVEAQEPAEVKEEPVVEEVKVESVEEKKPVAKKPVAKKTTSKKPAAKKSK